MDKTLRGLIEIVKDINLLLASCSLSIEANQKINDRLNNLVEMAELEESIRDME